MGANATHFVSMYGTKHYMICDEGAIISAKDYSTITTPKMRKPESFDQKINLQDPFPISLTLAQFLMYTFHGYTPSKIRLKWDFEDITEANLVYVFDEWTPAENAIIIDGEEFRAIEKYRHKKDGRDNYYINQYGSMVYWKGGVTAPKSLKWHHSPGGYPDYMLKTTTFQIHRLVYEAFVGEIPEGMTINHDDHNLWNPSVRNLSVLTRSSNSIEGNAARGHSKLTESAVLQIAEMLIENLPIREIADIMSEETSIPRDNMLSMIYSIKDKRSYAHITANYNFENCMTHRGVAGDEDRIRAACQLLQDHPELYNSEISRRTGVPPTSVRYLRSGNPGHFNDRIMNIRNEYNINSANNTDKGRFAPKLTADEVREIYRLTKTSQVTNKELGQRYGVADEVIRGIRHRRTSLSYQKALEGFMENEE